MDAKKTRNEEFSLKESNHTVDPMLAAKVNKKFNYLFR